MRIRTPRPSIGSKILYRHKVLEVTRYSNTNNEMFHVKGTEDRGDCGFSWDDECKMISGILCGFLSNDSRLCLLKRGGNETDSHECNGEFCIFQLAAGRGNFFARWVGDNQWIDPSIKPGIVYDED